MEHNFNWKNDGRTKVMIGCGTRPEIIRLAAVIKRCREYFDCCVVYYNQNWDRNLSTVFWEDFELKNTFGEYGPDILVPVVGENLEIGYFEQEIKGENRNTCIDEIWEEFPSFSQYEVRSALAKCGLTTKHIESLVRVLSGGEQAKVRLCKLINKSTNVLLLDEPTNHLDVDAKDELKRALQEYRGSILLICHEPEFYQEIVNEVWDCSKWTTKIL